MAEVLWPCQISHASGDGVLIKQPQQRDGGCGSVIRSAGMELAAL
jgi:hypothetical protein